MPEITVDPNLRFRVAYDQALPDILAVPAEALLTVGVDIPSAVIRALGSMPEIRAQRDKVAQLPFFDLAAFDKLETYALALGRAHTVHITASQPRAPLAELIEKSTRKRETLASDAAALAHRGLIDGHKLKELKGAVGYKNVAQDLLVLTELLRVNYAALAGKTPVTLDELAEAEILAEQIYVSVGEREEGPTATAQTADIRVRAYTLFARTWEQARRAIAYVRFTENDVDDIVPSLFAGRNAAARKRGEDEAQPGEAPATPAAPPANGSSSTPTPVGLPGSDPFARLTF